MTTRKQAKALHDSGRTINEIAELLGIRPYTAKGYLWNEGIVLDDPDDISWSPAKDKILLQLEKRGKSYAEIGTELGVSRSAICSRFYVLRQPDGKQVEPTTTEALESNTRNLYASIAASGKALECFI